MSLKRGPEFYIVILLPSFFLIFFRICNVPVSLNCGNAFIREFVIIRFRLMCMNKVPYFPLHSRTLTSKVGLNHSKRIVDKNILYQFRIIVLFFDFKCLRYMYQFHSTTRVKLLLILTLDKSYTVLILYMILHVYKVSNAVGITAA